MNRTLSYYQILNTISEPRWHIKEPYDFYKQIQPTHKEIDLKYIKGQKFLTRVDFKAKMSPKAKSDLNPQTLKKTGKCGGHIDLKGPILIFKI